MDKKNVLKTLSLLATIANLCVTCYMFGKVVGKIAERKKNGEEQFEEEEEKYDDRGFEKQS